MPIEADWLILDHIYEIRLSGEINLADIEALHEIDLKILECGSKNQIHAIYDFTDVTGFRRVKLLDMMRLLDHDRLRRINRRRGWVILLGSHDTVLCRLYASLMQLLRIQYRQVDTMDDAMSLLGRLAATTPLPTFARNA